MINGRVLRTYEVLRKPTEALLIGFITPIIAFITSSLLFSGYWVRHLIGISTILFTVIIVMPIVNKILTYEERIEARKIGFFKKHEAIINFFIYFFIGCFISFFVLSMLYPQRVFSETSLYGGEYQSIQALRERYQSSVQLPPRQQGFELMLSIFENNIYIMLISFALSLFYGAGSLFLIILNASVFASTLARVVQIKVPEAFGFFATYSYLGCNMGVMFLHMIPEVGAYLIAAIAGGVLSRGVIREKLLSKSFLAVLKSSFLLMIAAFAVLLGGAIIESFVSLKLIMSNVCVNNYLLFIEALVLILVVAAIGKYLKIKLSKKPKNIY